MKQNNYIINFIKVTFISILLMATSPVRAEIKVVTTIKPLHSLVANVMQGVGEPSLIIEGSTSPHSFTLKPSHAKLLEEADLIFWIGEGIETFMERPLESIVKNAEVVEFMEVESIEKLKFREEDSCFVPHQAHQQTISVGSCNGVFDLRSILKETNVSVNQLIYPLFIVDGFNVKISIESMPNCYRWSLDLLLIEIESCIKSVLKVS